MMNFYMQKKLLTNEIVGTNYTDSLDFWKLVTGNVTNMLVM